MVDCQVTIGCQVTVNGLASSETDGVSGSQVARTFADEVDGMLSNGFFADVVQCIAGQGHVRAVRGGNGDGAINELAAGDVDTFALFQLQQRRETRLTGVAFVVNAAAGESDVRGIYKTHACAILRGVTAESVAANVDEARVLD